VLVPYSDFFVLVTQDRDYDSALTPAHIAFQMKDLLPRSQHQLAIGDRHRQGRPQHRRLKM